MYTDAQNRFSQAQSLAVAAGTTLATNVIDLLAPNRNIGRGQQKRIVALVTTAFAGGTSVRAEVVESANADLSSGTVLISGGTVQEANLTVGRKLLDVSMPDTSKRYLGVQYVTLGTHTAGAVFAGVVSDSDNNPYLPANTGL